jgi:hypothetical protein
MKGERAARYELTGLQRTYLETVRERMTDEDRRDDTDFAVSLDDEGVARLRPASLGDQLDQLIARWLYDAGYVNEVGE